MAVGRTAISERQFSDCVGHRMCRRGDGAHRQRWCRQAAGSCSPPLRICAYLCQLRASCAIVFSGCSHREGTCSTGRRLADSPPRTPAWKKSAERETDGLPFGGPRISAIRSARRTQRPPDRRPPVRRIRRRCGPSFARPTRRRYIAARSRGQTHGTRRR